VAPTTKSPGTGLKKKVAGQPTWAWLAEVIAAGGIFIYLRARSTAAAGTASTAAEDTTDEPITTDNSDSESAGTTYSTFGQWEEAALASMVGPTYSSTQAFNDLNSWINGNCVSATGYTLIGQFITSGGLPPGFGSDLPALSVCASSTTTGSTTTSDINPGGPVALVAQPLTAAEAATDYPAAGTPDTTTQPGGGVGVSNLLTDVGGGLDTGLIAPSTGSAAASGALTPAQQNVSIQTANNAGILASLGYTQAQIQQAIDTGISPTDPATSTPQHVTN
jgi:hypothetical protein